MTKPAPSLTQKATSGVAWSSIFQVSRQLLSLVSVSVLAHKIPPSAYGLLAMAAILSNFFETFRDLGTTNAIVRETDVSGNFESTLFWTHCILGLAVSTCVYALAFPSAKFFQEPAIVPVVQALAASFVLTGLGTVPSALLTRRMAFRQLAIAQFGAALIGTAVSITLAFMDKGVWCLVAASLVNAAVSTIGYWIFNPLRIRWVFDFAVIRSISRFSLNLSAFGLINYFTRNADNLIVGRFLGSAPLGVYQMGYTVMSFPLQNFSQMIASVVFPAMTTVKDDDARLRSAFIRTSTLVALFTFPAMLGLLVTADPFVRTVLNQKWLSLTPVLRVFAPLGMAQSVFTLVGIIYNVKGRTDWLFRWGCFLGTLSVLSFFAGLRWGILGVATAYALTWTLLAPLGLAIPLRLIQLPLRSYLTHLWTVMKPSLVMAAVAAAWLAGIDAMGVSNAPLRLLTTATVGAVCYWTLIRRWRTPALLDLLDTLDHSRNRLAVMLAGYLRIPAQQAFAPRSNAEQA
jgi:O-antigen/teichoic acid export membrane protein